MTARAPAIRPTPAAGEEFGEFCAVGTAAAAPAASDVATIVVIILFIEGSLCLASPSRQTGGLSAPFHYLFASWRVLSRATPRPKVHLVRWHFCALTIGDLKIERLPCHRCGRAPGRHGNLDYLIAVGYVAIVLGS